MELRTASSPRDVKTYDTQRLREEFLIDDLFRADDIKLVYSHIDRIITGSAVPVKGTLALTAGEELRAQYFLERRALGVINLGGEGTVTVDGTVYTLRHRDGLYVGRGSKDIVFASKDAANPAKFYLNSCPAHTAYPTVYIRPEDCVRQELGSLETANHRTICKYIMPLAETASIFNEQLLAHMVLKDASPDEQLSLLEGNLMETNQTIVDIYSRYLFETEVIDTRADHAMSVDELKDAMLRAQEASYGDGLDPEIRHPYMWACKSHYYSSGYNFYNFPYAFGELFAKGVFAQYLQKGAAFVPDYCRLLRSCGSGTIADVAASVGIDVRNPDFWRSSLEVVKGNIDKFCELVK